MRLSGLSVRALCESAVLFQRSHLRFQTSHFALPLHTHTSSHLILSQLISPHLSSSRLISSHMSSKSSLDFYNLMQKLLDFSSHRNSSQLISPFPCIRNWLLSLRFSLSWHKPCSNLPNNKRSNMNAKLSVPHPRHLPDKNGITGFYTNRELIQKIKTAQRAKPWEWKVWIRCHRLVKHNTF